jgi:hypothetical protein
MVVPSQDIALVAAQLYASRFISAIDMGALSQQRRAMYRRSLDIVTGGP